MLNLDEDAFTSNYISALQVIFSRIWDYACEAIGPSTATLWDKTEKAIQCADEIIKNMSLCIVLTENESDANKLFEVLNDRSLDVEDLESIKNHFYKEYCTKSKDSDEDKDRRISQLDELWADKVSLSWWMKAVQAGFTAMCIRRPHLSASIRKRC